MILYHVRTASAVTIDMLETRDAAIELATKEGLEVYELNRTTGLAVRIH